MDVFEKVDHVVNSRIPTGISKLDEIISGGFPCNSIILVSGTPGSGKTILCYHYISEGLKNGEKCLFLTSDERVENILKQAEELGFDFQKYVNSEQLKFVFLDLEKSDIHNEMHNEIKEGRFTRVVLDSITPVSEIPIWASDGVNEFIPTDGVKSIIKYPAGSISATRLHLRRIISILNKNDCTSIVTSEVEEGSRSLSRDTISEFLVDGIILLDLDVTMDRRKLTVRKMRATKHTLRPHDINISHGGIHFI
jgi:circadian clock protein KaiC